MENHQQLSEMHKGQRDSARTQRDSALVERDSARLQRDDLIGEAVAQKQDSLAQSQFVAAVSHDLRNPISAVKMAVEVLRDNIDHNIRMKMVDLIERNADQAGELINQLLDAHLIKSGAKLPVQIQRCNLIDILKKCHLSLAPREQSNLSVTLGEDMIGFWDPGALERAFKNLINNAYKFGDAEKRVEVNYWQGPDITSITVKNFGEIISLEDQLKIFDNHFRVQRVDKSKRGWGLGLTLVRGIAEAHGGKVEVTSSLIEGTMFTIKIPNDCRAAQITS